MAKMVPLELKEGEYLSDSEKDVFDALKAGLSDEWVVVYSYSMTKIKCFIVSMAGMILSF